MATVWTEPTETKLAALLGFVCEGHRLNRDDVRTRIFEASKAVPRRLGWSFEKTLESGDIEVRIDSLRPLALYFFEDFAQDMLSKYPDLESYHIELVSSDLLSIYLDFYRDGVFAIETGFVNPIPYSAESCRRILTPVIGNLGSIDLPKFSPDGPTFQFWLVRLVVSDATWSVGQMQDAFAAAGSLICLNDDKIADDGAEARILEDVRSGRFDQVIGVTESRSVEFKSFVDLASDSGKLGLARAVARFANSDQHGHLMIGFQTSRKNGQDTVAKMTPLVVGENSVQRYMDVIDGRVYPPVCGLSIESITVDGEHIVLLVTVPLQRETDKPFLVHGEIIDGKLEGAFFSIVRRRGEGAVPITAKELHAVISAGYRVLRGGQV